MNRWVILVLSALVGCGGNGVTRDDAGTDGGTATDAGHDAGICALASTCPVTWPACQSRTCDETLGCGPVVAIRESFSCDDGNANTYDDACSAGTCAGTPTACSTNNGGCGSATCVGHDPAPPTCVCSGRYTVTETTAVDSQTGLEWEREASTATRTQAASVTYCSSKGGGWRAPTREELQAIVTGIVGPRIDACAFPATTPSVYWTSSAVAGMPGVYWASDFGDGSTPGGETGDNGSALHLVRCVR